MALFSNEREKSAHPEQSARPHTGLAQAAPPIASAAAAFLDSGTKVSGKLHFQCPARIDGEIDGKEITIGRMSATVALMRFLVTPEFKVDEGTPTVLKATSLSVGCRRISTRKISSVRAVFRPKFFSRHRGFESTPLRQPVRDFYLLCGEVENTAHVREVCSIKGHRRIQVSASCDRLAVDSLCREPSRCPLHHSSFAAMSAFFRPSRTRVPSALASC